MGERGDRVHTRIYINRDMRRVPGTCVRYIVDVHESGVVAIDVETPEKSVSVALHPDDVERVLLAYGARLRRG